MAEVNFQLRADVQQALSALRKVEGQLRDAGDEADHASSRASQALGRWGNALKGLGIAATTVAVGGIALLGKKAIEMGMDAVESENLFTVSMGNMANAAREWSQTTSKALGLNEFELRKNIGVIFQMTSSMGLGKDSAFEMATGISQLANDMASFFNLDPADAFAKLQAGITGEAEPLKRLGILVDETTAKMTAMRHGIIKQGEQMSQTQKVQARWLAITEQTKNAQGDLARTLDSPANKMRILQTRVEELTTKIGIALLPVFEHLLGIAETMIGALSGMSSGFGDVGGTTKDAADGAKRLADVVSLPIQAFLALGQVMHEIIAEFLRGVDTIATKTRQMLLTLSSIPGLDAATFGGMREAIAKLNAGIAETRAEIRGADRAAENFDNSLKGLRAKVFGMTNASGEVMNRIITGMDPTKTNAGGAGEATGERFAGGFAKGVKGKLGQAVEDALQRSKIEHGELQGIMPESVGPLAPSLEAGIPGLMVGPSQETTAQATELDRIERELQKMSGVTGISSGLVDTPAGVLGPEEESIEERSRREIRLTQEFDRSMREAMEGVSSWSETVLGSVDHLKSFGLNLNSLSGFLQKFLGGFGGGGGIFGKILGIGLSFVPGLGGLGGLLGGGIGKSAATAPTLKLAGGGVITEPAIGMTASGTEFMVGESGPEAVVPLTGGGMMGGGSETNALLMQVVETLGRLTAKDATVVVGDGVKGAGGVFNLSTDRDKKKFGQAAFQGSVV